MSAKDIVDDLMATIRLDYAPDLIVQGVERLDAHVTDLEARLKAATDLAKRQCERIEELEAERDARPAAIEWRPRRCAEEAQELWIGSAGLGEIRRGGDRGEWFWCGPGPMDLTKFSMFYPTPEAAKAAVEEALRGLSAKTEG